jgi:hypothetical protein
VSYSGFIEILPLQQKVLREKWNKASALPIASFCVYRNNPKPGSSKRLTQPAILAMALILESFRMHHLAGIKGSGSVRLNLKGVMPVIEKHGRRESPCNSAHGKLNMQRLRTGRCRGKC